MLKIKTVLLAVESTVIKICFYIGRMKKLAALLTLNPKRKIDLKICTKDKKNEIITNTKKNKKVISKSFFIV